MTPTTSIITAIVTAIATIVAALVTASRSRQGPPSPSNAQTVHIHQAPSWSTQQQKSSRGAVLAVLFGGSLVVILFLFLGQTKGPTAPSPEGVVASAGPGSSPNNDPGLTAQAQGFLISYFSDMSQAHTPEVLNRYFAFPVDWYRKKNIPNADELDGIIPARTPESQLACHLEPPRVTNVEDHGSNLVASSYVSWSKPGSGTRGLVVVIYTLVRST